MQRDAQALAAAGVPIVSVRGPAGGYRLERGYRTKLTGLDAAEAEALFVGPAAELGLGRELAAARLKLLASLPAELQERAGRAARLFHVDTRGWFREEDRVPHLPVIAGALWRGRRLEIRYREGAAVVSRRLDPLGLILKAGVWYLLAQRRGEERVYRVSRIVSARERAEPGTRPQDFDLAAAWARRSEAFERSRTRIDVTVRIPRRAGPLPPRSADRRGRRAADRDRTVRGARSRLPCSARLRPAGGGARSARAARANRGCGSRDGRPLRGASVGRRLSRPSERPLSRHRRSFRSRHRPMQERGSGRAPVLPGDQAVHEALAPAGVDEAPAELALRLRVRRSTLAAAFRRAISGARQVPRTAALAVAGSVGRRRCRRTR